MYLTKRFYEIPYTVIKNDIVSNSKSSITDYGDYIKVDIKNKEDLNTKFDSKCLESYSILDECFSKYMNSEEEIRIVNLIKKSFSKNIYDIISKRNIIWYNKLAELLSSQYGFMVIYIRLVDNNPKRKFIQSYFNFLKTYNFIETMKKYFYNEFKSDLEKYYTQNNI